VVGASGFEPPTSWSRKMQSTKSKCFIWRRLGVRKPFFLSLSCTETGSPLCPRRNDGSRTSDGTRERQGKPRVNYCGPRSTGEPRPAKSISDARDPPLATDTTRPQPEAPAHGDSNVQPRNPVASPTSRAPSLSRATLHRQSSAIRAVCANERLYGSVRGVPGNWYPYRDRRQLFETTSSFYLQWSVM